MFEKLKNSKLAKAVATGTAAVGSLVTTGMTALAEGNTDVSAVQSAMETGFNGVKTNAITMITTALPIALAIVGIVLAIRLGVKFFKGIANK